MRSFLEYRKNKLQSKISEISIQEAVTGYFDILRLDLLETVKLPELLFEGSLITESAYNAARKEDYADNKEIIELIISESKGNFCSRLFNEDIASNLPIDAFVDEIKQLIQGEVETLKQQVARSLNASRPTGPEPEAGPEATVSWKDKPISGAQIGALGYYSKKHGAKLPPNAKNMTQGQASDLITQFEKQYGPLPNRSGAPSGPTGVTPAAAPNVSNGDDLDVGDEPMNGSASGTPSSVSASGAGSKPFTPAPRGNIRPSDGFLQGLKRTVWDPVAGWAKDKWRNFRRRWHNDPLREHKVFLETIFLENYGDLSKVIEDFGKALTDMLVKRVRAYVAGTTGKPASATSTKDGVPTSVRSGSQTTTTKPPANDEKDSDVQEPETADMARAVAPEAGAEAGAEEEAGEDEKEETPVEEVNLYRGANSGAKLLGIGINPDHLSVRGSWTAKTKPSSFTDSEGQPLVPRVQGETGDEKEAGWAKLRNKLIDLLFAKRVDSEQDPVSKAALERLGRSKTQRGPAVRSWLGITSTGSKSAVKDLLFKYHAFDQQKKGIKTVLKTRKDKSGEAAPAAASPDAAVEKPASQQPQKADVNVRKMEKTGIDPKTGFPKDPIEFAKKIAAHPTLSKLESFKGELDYFGGNLDGLIKAFEKALFDGVKQKDLLDDFKTNLKLSNEDLLKASGEQAGEDSEKKKLNPAPEDSPAAASEESPPSKPADDQNVAVEPRTEQSDAWRTDPVAFLNKIKEIPSLLRDANERLEVQNMDIDELIKQMQDQLQNKKVNPANLIHILTKMLGVDEQQIEEALQRKTQTTPVVKSKNNEIKKEPSRKEEDSDTGESFYTQLINNDKYKKLREKHSDYLNSQGKKQEEIDDILNKKANELADLMVNSDLNLPDTVAEYESELEKVSQVLNGEDESRPEEEKQSEKEPEVSGPVEKSKGQIILDRAKEFFAKEYSTEENIYNDFVEELNKIGGIEFLNKTFEGVPVDKFPIDKIIGRIFSLIQGEDKKPEPVKPEVEEEKETAPVADKTKKATSKKAEAKKPEPVKPEAKEETEAAPVAEKTKKATGKKAEAKKPAVKKFESPFDDERTAELEQLIDDFRQEGVKIKVNSSGDALVVPNKDSLDKVMTRRYNKNKEDLLTFLVAKKEANSEKSMRAEGFTSALNRFRELIRS
jgi:hypothetical protein